MITNETRARLLGWERAGVVGSSGWLFQGGTFHDIPRYDTDANAVAELREFVRARGKQTEFVAQLARLTPAGSMSSPREYGWYLLEATPQRQAEAFDIVFKTDLERINAKQS